ncbi:MAG: hypothetical protein KDA24_09570 [Deltaproteobacteria bacterium]|nr:hypothetical protein [Deltaproteobacteria bacterium]
MHRAVVLLLSLILLASCATTQGSGRTTSDGWTVQRIPNGNDKGKEVAWRAGSPGSDWSRDSAQTADFAWVHRSAPATIYGDSTCGKKYYDVPLSVLINHLTFGFEDLQTDAQEEIDLAGRAGLRRVFSASLDGIPVKLASTVVKKGPCIFDLVYVTADVARFDAELADYETVVAGLAIREGR